jgi:hypothetical protein
VKKRSLLNKNGSLNKNRTLNKKSMFDNKGLLSKTKSYLKEADYSGLWLALLVGSFIAFMFWIRNPENYLIVKVNDVEMVDRKIHLFNDEHKIEIIVDKKDYNNYQILIDKKAVNLKLTNPDELLENSRLVNSGLMDVEISYHFEKDSDKVKDIGLLFVKRYSSTYSNNNFW